MSEATITHFPQPDPEEMRRAWKVGNRDIRDAAARIYRDLRKKHPALARAYWKAAKQDTEALMYGSSFHGVWLDDGRIVNGVVDWDRMPGGMNDPIRG